MSDLYSLPWGSFGECGPSDHVLLKEHEITAHREAASELGFQHTYSVVLREAAVVKRGERSWK